MMKKFTSIALALCLLLCSITVGATDKITITLDGVLLETKADPVIVNSSTMVPFRAIFEALKMDVTWSEALQKVYAMNDEKTIILTIGSTSMLVNTELKTLPVAPFISNGHTLVPVRAISEAVGCDVDWDGEERKVILKTEGYVEPGPGEEPINTEEPNENSNPDEEIASDANPFTPVIDDVPAYINKNNDEAAKELIDLINAARADYGLDKLVADANLCDVALSHSKDMAAYDYIDHISPTGTDPFERLDMAGIYYMSAAENIASGFLKSEDVLSSWMASVSHRQNLLNSDFTHIGVGYYAGGSNGTYWTLVLVGR